MCRNQLLNESTWLKPLARHRRNVRLSSTPNSGAVKSDVLMYVTKKGLGYVLSAKIVYVATLVNWHGTIAESS